jgi:hypothetical protein
MTTTDDGWQWPMTTMKMTTTDNDDDLFLVLPDSCLKLEQ